MPSFESASHYAAGVAIANPVEFQSGIVVPDCPPDFHFPDSSIDQWRSRQRDPAAIGGIWLPQGEAPGSVVVTYDERDLMKVDPKRDFHAVRYALDIAAVHKLGQTDVGPLLRAVGIHTAVYRNPQRPHLVQVDMSFPSTDQFCDNVDELADAGLVHVRFAPTKNIGEFTGWDQMRSMGEHGRILIARLATEQDAADEADKWTALGYYLHDLLDHYITALTMDEGSADNMYARAGRAHRLEPFDVGIFGALARKQMSYVMNHMEDDFLTPQMLFERVDPQARRRHEMFPGFKPAGRKGNVEAIRKHLATTAAALALKASQTAQ